jgi:hypothetical protein
MSRKFMNKSEFSRYCEVTPTAVQSAVADKRICTSSSGLIDANHPKNIAYRNHQLERKQKLAKGKSESKPYANRTPDNRKWVDPSDPPEGDELELEADGLPPLPPKKPLTPEEAALLAAGQSEIDYAIEKMRSTTAINKARLAEMVKATIRRDFVDKVISMIGTTISHHLLTMGDRLSPDLAAVAGSTEASVVRRIKQSLDKDVSATLAEMQRVVVDRYERKLED